MFVLRLCAAVALSMATALSIAGPLQPVTVQPSGNEVPANLLRISLVFSSPVSESVLRRLGLRQGDGRVIDQPFLEQELWSPSGKVLTVLLHPGRVKSGLIAHDQVGPVLRSSEVVVLTLDGRELKRWTVGENDLAGPVPSAWRIGSVRVGSREPLVVSLDGPIDARDVDYLVVADGKKRRVEGHAELAAGETRWTFTPASPWRSTSYTLAVFSNLEDAAGNRLGSHFETEVGEPPERVEDVLIPFTARR